MSNTCVKCGSEVKPTKDICAVCQYRQFQEKLTDVSIKTCDYYVILDALELACENKDGEKKVEFKETFYRWRGLSRFFETAEIL